MANARSADCLQLLQAQEAPACFLGQYVFRKWNPNQYFSVQDDKNSVCIKVRYSLSYVDCRHFHDQVRCWGWKRGYLWGIQIFGHFWSLLHDLLDKWCTKCGLNLLFLIAIQSREVVHSAGVPDGLQPRVGQLGQDRYLACPRATNCSKKRTKKVAIPWRVCKLRAVADHGHFNQGQGLRPKRPKQLHQVIWVSKHERPKGNVQERLALLVELATWRAKRFSARQWDIIPADE